MAKEEGIFTKIVMGCLAICFCLAGLSGGCLVCASAVSNSEKKRKQEESAVLQGFVNSLSEEEKAELLKTVNSIVEEQEAKNKETIKNEKDSKQKE